MNQLRGARSMAVSPFAEFVETQTPWVAACAAMTIRVSLPRKRQPKFLALEWVPAFAGMTIRVSLPRKRQPMLLALVCVPPRLSPE